jgi:hypothetical protein
MGCIYCKSSSYGKPCLFSSSNTHVHFDHPDRCIYCGSKNVGGGCLYNPNGKIHIRGPEFLTNVKEQLKNSSILKYLYENITKLDEKPMTPLSRFYKRLMEIVSSSSQFLVETLSLQSKPSFEQLSKTDFLKVNEYKEKLKYQYTNLFETIKNANLDLPQEIVEDILIDVILNDDYDKET